MAKSLKLTDEEQVTALIQQLDTPFSILVQQLRTLILNTSQEIGEQVKWNSPGFYYTGEMKTFDPKTYQRDIAVMNLRNGKILLIFPVGAKIKDNTSILEGNYADGRRVITINNAQELEAKTEALQNVLKEWLRLVEKKI